MLPILEKARCKLKSAPTSARYRAKVRAAACVVPARCRALFMAEKIRRKRLSWKLKQEAFHASILSMDLDGEKEQVLLRDIQMHPFKLQVLHIDFQRVDKNKKIHMKVPLHFINAEISPGVKLSAGLVSHVLTELDVSCLPKDLP